MLFFTVKQPGYIIRPPASTTKMNGNVTVNPANSFIQSVKIDMFERIMYSSHCDYCPKK